MDLSRTDAGSVSATQRTQAIRRVRDGRRRKIGRRLPRANVHSGTRTSRIRRNRPLSAPGAPLSARVIPPQRVVEQLTRGCGLPIRVAGLVFASAALATLLAACSAAKATPVNRFGYIPVSGGVHLAYNLTLPAATGRFPIALIYDHYFAGSDNRALDTPRSDAGQLLRAGFAVLGVSEPGSGCSSGTDNFLDVNSWAPAGAQAVEWAARQPWSTGHVGMFGLSWLGITQVGIAALRPKGLDAIAPFGITTDFYDVAYPGGIFNSEYASTYPKGVAASESKAAKIRIKAGDRECARNYAENTKRFPPSREFAAAAANPYADSFWQHGPGEHISQVDLPVLGCQSWQDGQVSSGATELYYNTFNKRTSWFIGMNGNHNACEFPEAGALTTMVRFFRHYVAGIDNGWQKTPHIIIDHEANLNGTPSWISAYNSWSQVMKPVTLYFQRDGSLATTPTTKRAAGSSPFSGPQPSQSGRWAKRPAPGSFVTYTSPPLAHDVDVFGPGSVNIWVSSTVPTPDIEAIISEVRPDGMEQYVQAGWLNLAQRRLAPAGTGPGQSSALAPYQTHTQTDLQPLTPRTPVYARLQLLPFEHVFQKGSSIRITLNSADGPVQASGGWGLTGNKHPFRDTIYTSPVQQSEVVLGLIPGATAKRPPRPCGQVLDEPCRPNHTPVPAGTLNIG